MNHARPLLAFAALWSLQIALANLLPLVADEAYYLAWSQRLGPGYLDHPPGVAWWIALGLGHPRLTGLVMMPLAWGLLADAARRWGIVDWRWVPALGLATPLGFSAGLLVTPDVPLVWCACLAIWAVAAERPLIAGLAAGLGLWSKSAMLVALPGLWWALGPVRGLWAMGVALAIYAPHIHWSAMHDGLPWSFQAAHRRFHGAPWRVFEAIGAQALVVTPFVFWLALRAWRAPLDAIGRQLRVLGLPVLVLWMGMGLVVRVEANWAALAWPATLLLIVRQGGWRRPVRWAAGFTVCAALALPALDAAFPLRGPPRDGARLRACLPAERLIARRYQEKALLDAAGADVGYLRAAGHRPSQYDTWGVADDLCGAWYLGDVDAVGGRCRGAVDTRVVCGQPITVCTCAVVPVVRP